MRRLRPSPVVTFALMAISPACSTTPSVTSDASADDASTDHASTDDAANSCPALHVSCATGTADLACLAPGGYPDNRRCLAGVWCRTYLNPPPPPAQPGDCPSVPPIDGTACSTTVALVDCAYSCNGTVAHAICHGGAWCGVVASNCTRIVDGG